MKNILYKFAILLSLPALLYNCGSDEGEINLEQSLELPLTDWGATKAQIKAEMQDYALRAEMDDLLVYKGKNIENIISYEFRDDKLYLSNIIIEADRFSPTAVTQLFENYTELAEYDNTTYINESTNTLAEISPITSYDNSICCYCISWGNLNIDIAEAVDLGLSVKWATCNIGAVLPEECGNYYAWGETEPKEIYDWDTYIYWSDLNFDGDYSSSEITNIGSNISGTQYDVAKLEWGEQWRMPTKEEFEELLNCEWEQKYVNGCHGYEVTGPNGNSIFLPYNDCKYQPCQDEYGADKYSGFLNNDGLGATIHLWSGTHYHYVESSAYELFYSLGNGSNFIATANKARGCGIRAVTK